jgi:hypothetical protein
VPRITCEIVLTAIASPDLPAGSILVISKKERKYIYLTVKLSKYTDRIYTKIKINHKKINIKATFPFLSWTKGDLRTNGIFA